MVMNNFHYKKSRGILTRFASILFSLIFFLCIDYLYSYINKLNRPIYLDFSSCDNLEEYIHYSDNIVSIKFSNTKFKWIPDNMQSVKFLYLDNFQNISNIDNISKMN